MPQESRNCTGRLFIRLAVYTLAISIIILYILCLTGSTYTNPHIPQIFLGQIKKSNTSLQIGFYGICADVSSPNLICTTTINRSADTITAALFPNEENAASFTSLVSLGLDLQQRTLLNPLPIAAGLFLLSLIFIALTRIISKRQSHLTPSRRLRYLKIFTSDLEWISTSLAFTTAVLATGMVNWLAYFVSAIGNENGDLNISAGGLLQVLLWVLFGVELVFSVVVMGVLRDRRSESWAKGDDIIDFEGWNEFENDHIIVF